MGPMKILTRETYRMIKLNFKNLLIFELVYRLITGPIIWQAMNYGLRFALRMAGYSYLTLGNLGHFLIRPWTVLVVLGIAALGLLLMMIEVGSLITACTAASYSVRLGPLDIFLGGIENLTDSLKRKNIKLMGIVLIEMVLLNSYYLYRILTRIKPLDFLMETILLEPWVRILLIVAAILLILAAIPCTFVLQGCMIGQKSFADSLNLSRDLLRGRRVKTVCSLVGYQLAVILGLMVCYALCVVFACVLVLLFVDKRLEFVFLMETAVRIEIVLLLLGSAVSGVVFSAASTVQYCQGANRIHHEPGWDFNHSTGKVRGRRNIVVGLGIIGIASGLCLFDTAYNGNAVTKAMTMETEITAHRGSSKTAPENTIEAVYAAVEEMADWVEIDVQETADGQVVLSHDASLKRTAGVNWKVSELTYEELGMLDVGSWFSKEYAGVRIPSLDQVMDYAKGRIDLNIELKSRNGQSQLPEKVLALVNEYEMQEQCVITSTNIEDLRRIKELQPEIKTGLILSAAYGDYYSNDAMDFISIRSGFVTEHVVERSHEAGKAVHVWTVNSREELERLKLLGVDNVITDRPVFAREILYRDDVAENILEYLRLLLR